jgi:hypothetical protein
LAVIAGFTDGVTLDNFADDRNDFCCPTEEDDNHDDFCIDDEGDDDVDDEVFCTAGVNDEVDLCTPLKVNKVFIVPELALLELGESNFAFLLLLTLTLPPLAEVERGLLPGFVSPLAAFFWPLFCTAVGFPLCRFTSKSASPTLLKDLLLKPAPSVSAVQSLTLLDAPPKLENRALLGFGKQGLTFKV